MGAFTNPHDYRELMKAAVGYSDKTVEQVQAEIEQRQKAAESKTRSRSSTTAAAPRPQVGGEIGKGHMDALSALRAAAEQAKAQADND